MHEEIKNLIEQFDKVLLGPIVLASVLDEVVKNLSPILEEDPK